MTAHIAFGFVINGIENSDIDGRFLNKHTIEKESEILVYYNTPDQVFIGKTMLHAEAKDGDFDFDKFTLCAVAEWVENIKSDDDFANICRKLKDLGIKHDKPGLMLLHQDFIH